MSMYTWLKWLNYVSAFGENVGDFAAGSEILHRVILENIPFFHPKKPRGTPKKSHSSSKIFSSKPISFKGPRLWVFGLFLFRGFLNHRGMMIFPRGSPFVGWWAAVDEDISHWRGLIHPKLAWVFWQELHSKKPTSKQETPRYVHPLDVFWKVTILKRKTILFPIIIFLEAFAIMYIIYQLSNVFFMI